MQKSLRGLKQKRRRGISTKKRVFVNIAQWSEIVESAMERLLSQRRFSSRNELARALEAVPGIAGNIKPYYLGEILRRIEARGKAVPKSKFSPSKTARRQDIDKAIAYYHSLGGKHGAIAKTARKFGFTSYRIRYWVKKTQAGKKE